MKKIPTLFKRIYNDHKIVGITDEVTNGCECILDGAGVATIKYDGSCTAIIDGIYYKRFDAKNGRNITDGAIKCDDQDPITGHFPHWVKVDFSSAGDKWYVQAYKNARGCNLEDGTYEAVGPHFKGNPYNLSMENLIAHGKYIVDVPRTFDGIKEYLQTHYIEGLVFWVDGKPLCKIKRTDFNLPWNEK